MEIILLIALVIVIILLIYIFYLLKIIKRLKNALKNSTPVDFYESLRNEVINYNYGEEKIPLSKRIFSKLNSSY